MERSSLSSEKLGQGWDQRGGGKPLVAWWAMRAVAALLTKTAGSWNRTTLGGDGSVEVYCWDLGLRHDLDCLCVQLSLDVIDGLVVQVRGGNGKQQLGALEGRV